MLSIPEMQYLFRDHSSCLRLIANVRLIGIAAVEDRRGLPIACKQA
jgi:hypothetical protein